METWQGIRMLLLKMNVDRDTPKRKRPKLLDRSLPLPPRSVGNQRMLVG